MIHLKKKNPTLYVEEMERKPEDVNAAPFRKK